MSSKIGRKDIDKICQALADEGKLIEAGWISMKYSVLSLDAPQIQLEEMRMAFFGGAQHLFGSMMGILDEKDEPTELDLKRMDNIDQELRRFLVEFKKKHNLKDFPDE